MYLLSILKQSYIILAQPYQRPIDNKIAIINELILSAYLTTFLFFTEANDNTDILHTCDLVLLTIAGLFAFINFGSYIIAAIGPLITKCIKYLRLKDKAKMKYDLPENKIKVKLKKQRKKSKISLRKPSNTTLLDESIGDPDKWMAQLEPSVISNIKKNAGLRSRQGKQEEQKENRWEQQLRNVESINANEITNNIIDIGDNYCYRIEEDDFVQKEVVQKQLQEAEYNDFLGYYRFPDV
ncbi:hypothetical protein FGO68_gene15463 [Halteria grandinella]|uniref:Uncharacterized protein n=1 Tax=Halteria grandinella TaxID=5974 RepID=A0A8J8P3P7_HALGN|nr:hypothetical protein FGO68_gene15463 [Halteria grandinella]